MTQFIRTKWYPDELVFLKKNFYLMHNDELLEHINSNRSNKIKAGAMAHQCKRMGLCRGIQIRWSSADVKFLKRTYHTVGDTVLADLLNTRKSTFRVIDGKKVYRVFTLKHVCKKRSLLGLVRTSDELKLIRKANEESGAIKNFTKESNLWNRGIRTPLKDGEVTIQRRGKNRVRAIKVNGKFTPYTRWFYKNYIGPVGDKQRVRHIDYDCMNDEVDNLEVRDMRADSYGDWSRGLFLISAKLESLIKEIGKRTSAMRREEELELQKEISRIRRIKESLEFRINRYNQNKK